MVLAGPPGLRLRKPAALAFPHCADLRRGAWELALYHCDSFPSSSSGNNTHKSSSTDRSADNGEESPWVKLVTLGREQQDQSSSVLASIDLQSCHLLTDFFTRFCVVGQVEKQFESFLKKVPVF